MQRVQQTSVSRRRRGHKRAPVFRRRRREPEEGLVCPACGEKRYGWVTAYTCGACGAGSNGPD